jgi:arylamine N-acetyltransferase
VNSALLDPSRHQPGVDRFFDHFHVNTETPGLALLEEILHHFAGLPYENISKIIKANAHWGEYTRSIRLPEEVIADHISCQLGGTCFSLTFFLQAILSNSGFECYPVMADMRAGNNIHCCMIVLMDGRKYLVDPGYLLTRPMELNPDNPRLFNTKFAGVELRYDTQQKTYELYTFNELEMKWRYRFRDKPVADQEFLQHWLASFRWNSMHYLCLTKVYDNGLLYIRKDFMRETRFSKKKNYNVKHNLPEAVEDNFGIDREIVAKAQAALSDNLEKERESGLWVPRGVKK